jgi:hypothetical protein
MKKTGAFCPNLTFDLYVYHPKQKALANPKNLPGLSFFCILQLVIVAVRHP